MTRFNSFTIVRLPFAYIAPAIHRGGGMERAAFEVMGRLKGRRRSIAISRECDLPGIRHVVVRAPDRPAMVSVAWFRWKARRALVRIRRELPSLITTGIGASGGPVDVVVAQYCQAAYRQRVGAVRGRGVFHTLYHWLTLARFCAEERAVYQGRQLKRVIAVSRGVGRELIEFYGVAPSLIRYIPNGVDFSTFHPLPGGNEARQALRVSLGLPVTGFLTCFVGGDWRRKGLRPAIQALGDLPDVHLVVVGAGNKDEFAAIATAVGAADRVHFVGKQPEPHRYMQAADAYLFPSLYEAFSLSCIEAAACGLPLVVTKINGTEELVEDGVNGFFVEHDAISIAARLRQLRDDPALRYHMAEQSAEIGLRYGWDAIAAEHEKVYAEIDAMYATPVT